MAIAFPVSEAKFSLLGTLATSYVVPWQGSPSFPGWDDPRPPAGDKHGDIYPLGASQLHPQVVNMTLSDFGTGRL